MPAHHPTKRITFRYQAASVDKQLEQLDPNPDIWKLFRVFDDRFFDGELKKRVLWSAGHPG